MLADYQRKIKEVKNALAAYQNKKTNLDKKNVAAGRADPGKRDAAQKDVEKAQGEFAQEAMNFNKRLKAYQTERMTDTKVNNTKLSNLD